MKQSWSKGEREKCVLTKANTPNPQIYYSSWKWLVTIYLIQKTVICPLPWVFSLSSSLYPTSDFNSKLSLMIYIGALSFPLPYPYCNLIMGVTTMEL